MLHLMRLKRNSIITGKLSVSCEVVSYYTLKIIVQVAVLAPLALASLCHCSLQLILCVVHGIVHLCSHTAHIHDEKLVHMLQRCM